MPEEKNHILAILYDWTDDDLVQKTKETGVIERFRSPLLAQPNDVQEVFVAGEAYAQNQYNACVTALQHSSVILVFLTVGFFNNDSLKSIHDTLISIGEQSQDHEYPIYFIAMDPMLSIKKAATLKHSENVKLLALFDHNTYRNQVIPSWKKGAKSISPDVESEILDTVLKIRDLARKYNQEHILIA